MTFNRQSHIKAIDQAISELITLSARTATPAPIQHQYIGTVVDNTACLLTAPGNSLDNGNRVASFSEIPNWLSAMQAMHRSFYSSIHLATEKALEEYCDSKGIEVSSSIKRTANKEFEKIISSITDQVAKEKTEKLFTKLTRGLRPLFNDYLNAALKSSSLPKSDKATWRKFFNALTIVRNKSSHSDPSLTNTEIKKLQEGGFATLVSDAGSLQINPRNYFQISSFILDFFDILILINK
jgi:hypothetical protein